MPKASASCMGSKSWFKNENSLQNRFDAYFPLDFKKIRNTTQKTYHCVPHRRASGSYKMSATMSDQQMASTLNFLLPLLCSCKAPHLTVEDRSGGWTIAWVQCIDGAEKGVCGGDGVCMYVCVRVFMAMRTMRGIEIFYCNYAVFFIT